MRFEGVCGLMGGICVWCYRMKPKAILKLYVAVVLKVSLTEY